MGRLLLLIKYDVTLIVNPWPAPDCLQPRSLTTLSAIPHNISCNYCLNRIESDLSLGINLHGERCEIGTEQSLFDSRRCHQ